MMRSSSVESSDIESIMQWFEHGIEEGENGILVYPDLQTFREICAQYAKDQLVAREEQKEDEEEDNDDDDYYYDYDNDNNRRKEQLLNPRIILVATFYDTVNAVKHNLSAVGVDVQSHIDDGSLLIVDAFNSYYPDVDGMKKLVTSLSERARKENRAGVSAIVNMGFFFLYGSGEGEASELINYESSLLPKTDGGNVRGFSCYHVRNYNHLNDNQKKELLAQGQKKILEVTESTESATVAFSV
ncbi:MAG TPA: MEDS domain-containing protein [Nitrososphaera sp.]|nr:MEDS domain-containing protein [Nitrososphaera sp.]